MISATHASKPGKTWLLLVLCLLFIPDFAHAQDTTYQVIDRFTFADGEMDTGDTFHGIKRWDLEVVGNTIFAGGTTTNYGASDYADEDRFAILLTIEAEGNDLLIMADRLLQGERLHDAFLAADANGKVSFMWHHRNPRGDRSRLGGPLLSYSVKTQTVDTLKQTHRRSISSTPLRRTQSVFPLNDRFSFSTGRHAFKDGYWQSWSLLFQGPLLDQPLARFADGASFDPATGTLASCTRNSLFDPHNLTWYEYDPARGLLSDVFWHGEDNETGCTVIAHTRINDDDIIAWQKTLSDADQIYITSSDGKTDTLQVETETPHTLQEARLFSTPQGTFLWLSTHSKRALGSSMPAEGEVSGHLFTRTSAGWKQADLPFPWQNGSNTAVIQAAPLKSHDQLVVLWVNVEEQDESYHATWKATRVDLPVREEH